MCLGRQPAPRREGIATGRRSGSRTSRRTTLALAAALGALVVAAARCTSPSSDVVVTLALTPQSHVVNQATLARVELRDHAGATLSGATLELQAQMSHPGMAPLVVPLDDSDDGAYRASIRFTMAGEWVVTAAGTLADGRAVSQTTTVHVESTQ